MNKTSYEQFKEDWNNSGNGTITALITISLLVYFWWPIFLILAPILILGFWFDYTKRQQQKQEQARRQAMGYER